MGELVAGEDALYLRLEDPATPTHTVKTVVLDPSRLGRPVTLDDLHRWVPQYLHLTPRATQRVVGHLGGLKLEWVDVDVDLHHHLDEVVVEAPGDRAALDRLASAAAVRRLDRRRPLWGMTLVHGLADGRQAVIVRTQHAITDGGAWLNVLAAASTDTPGVVAPPAPPARRAPARSMGRWVGDLAASYRDQRRAVREHGAGKDLPQLMRRSPFNRGGGPERHCHSATVDLADLKQVARSVGVTVNGVFHSMVATAFRAELLDRGLPVTEPQVASFAVATNADPDRRHGNSLATSLSYLHCEVADPLERLQKTAASASRAVAYRSDIGFDYYRNVADLAQFVVPPARRFIGSWSPLIANQILTSNVAGPTSTRWFGPVEMVELISYSICTDPSLLGLGGYSYRGQMTFGLTAAGDVLPDPARFLARAIEALQELVELVGADRPAPTGV